MLVGTNVYLVFIDFFIPTQILMNLIPLTLGPVLLENYALEVKLIVHQSSGSVLSITLRDWLSPTQ